MPRFSNIFLPFLVNQTQKQKHKLISNKNKNTDTNPANRSSLSTKHKSNKHKPNTVTSFRPESKP